jgi:Cu-processing system ATP-binding protein
MNALATLADVTLRYGAVTAVENVTLELRAGETLALVGHNGAGKTTLVKLVLGLIAPSGGTVSVFQRDPATAGAAELRESLGFLPENVAFHGAMTGRELLRFYARLKRAPAAEVDGLLERVGLAAAGGRRVATYSKGMRQRLGLAQTLIGDPRLLLLDEPTSGLDPASRAEVFDMIDALRADGATILVSTHALAEVGERVDKVAVLHKGALLHSGSLADLRRETGAETRMRLRVQTCTTGTVLKNLPDGVRCASRDATHLELLVPDDVKMAVLRQLTDMPNVEDVEMTTPGLEELYRRLVADKEAAQ